jgi:methylated-DNA-[protein]-cysteine S-methyltransferase
MFYDVLPSPIGDLQLVAEGELLTGIRMVDPDDVVDPGAGWERNEGVFAEVRAQLAAYFLGELRQFRVPVALRGTSFQRRVWESLRSIPYGETISYARLAERIGDPRAVRAVGAANGRNPLPIIVPCHRVIGADGSLTGYAGGLVRKRMLLDLEGRLAGTLAGGRGAGPDRPVSRGALAACR